MDRPTVIRGRLAYAARRGDPPEVIEELRREYYASRARDYLRDWLAGDPAPTTAQRRELADLLVKGGDVMSRLGRQKRPRPPSPEDRQQMRPPAPTAPARSR